MTLPKIFVPNSPTNPLIEVLLEQYHGIDILWYHWLHDGDGAAGAFIREEDYEPVIIIYDRHNRVKRVIVRRHWEYKDAPIDGDHLDSLEVLFDTEFHAPYVKTRNTSSIFNAKSLQLQNIPHPRPIPITSNRISKKFRTGRFHRTNYRLRVKDPKKIAENMS